MDKCEEMGGMEYLIKKAKGLLEQDELVAIPTETVYGLAANAFSNEAVKKIFEAKKRPANNPLIVHLKSINSMDDVAESIPIEARWLALYFWPGPLTLILRKKQHISNIVSADLQTVGVRVPNHPLTLQLLKSLDFPLVAPSANRSNHISPTKPEHVIESLQDQAPYVLDGGECKGGIESTIVGFEGDEVVIYREGLISKTAIEEVIEKSVTVVKEQAQPAAPGSFKKHYSPKTRLVLTDDIENSLDRYEGLKLGVLLMKQSNKMYTKNQFTLSESGDLKEVARNLYSKLYDMDRLDLDVIIAEKAELSEEGYAINDRLTRAAS